MPNLDEILQAKQDRIDRLHRCQPGRTALLVIDMQHGFLDPGAALEVPQGREIVPNLVRLVETCRRKAIHVIFTEFVYSTAVPCLRGDPFGPEHLPAVPGEPTGFGRPSGNCLIGPGVPASQGGGEGCNSAETIPELAPRPDELVVCGHTYDKFLGTPLDLALRSRDVRYLIVTGIVTDVCVNSTVLAAANRDYRVTVVTDGVATLWPEIQRACLDIWRRKFARLRTTTEMVEEIGFFLNESPSPRK
jgi:nicotinamidase-related amidase